MTAHDLGLATNGRLGNRGGSRVPACPAVLSLVEGLEGNRLRGRLFNVLALKDASAPVHKPLVALNLPARQPREFHEER